MSRDDLHRELAPRSEAAAWLARLERTFTGLGGSFDADGNWWPDTDKLYSRADRLTSAEISDRLGIPVRDLWAKLRPADLTPRVIRFSGEAARGVTLRDVEAADRAFRRDPLVRVAMWYRDGYHMETGECGVPDSYESYVSEVRRFAEDGDRNPPPMLDLRREWEAAHRLLKR